MHKAEHRGFVPSDEIRVFEKGKAEILNLGGGVIGRFTLQPGWRWSEHVKPIAKTQWCEESHLYYQATGRLHVSMQDGTQLEIGPGEVAALPPGHDAWVVGNEPVVMIDWSGARTYARR
jgi:hypothetical protein